MTRTEKLLSEIIALPSVNPGFAPASASADGASAWPNRQLYGEKNVAGFLAAKAAKAGLEIEFQKVLPDRSNLIARLLPQNRIQQTVLLVPHLDTVGAPDAMFVPRRKNGRLYGRGATDTKGSVAAMMTALCELAEGKSRPLSTQIIFAGMVDEEHAQCGSRALAASGLKADLAIVGEPTNNQVVTAHKGCLWLQLETRGKAAHGSTPEFGKNAVHEMSRIVDVIETEYAAQLRQRKHKLLGTSTVNVGVISGGTQPNIVPARCAITIDRRTLPGETDPQIFREITQILRKHNLSAKISNTKVASSPAMETSPNLPLVRQFSTAIGQKKPEGVVYFCDAAVLSCGGIPSILFGPGDIGQAHTADEWISLAQLERAKSLLLKFLKSLS